ncbi:MAG: type II secretion system protein GspM [Maricaulaceae bacterium]
MMTWWRELAPRERMLIAMAAAVTVLAGGWQFVVAPAFAHRARAEARYEAALGLLAEIEAGTAQLIALGPQDQDGPPEPLEPRRLQPALIIAARAAGAPLTRLAPADDGEVEVWLDDAEPQTVYGWLQALERQHGVQAVRATVRRNDDGQTVRANFRLANPSGRR